MKSIIFAFLLLFSFTPHAQADKLRVLTTTADLQSVVEFIGGDRVEVDSLGNGNQNYHFLAAKPSYMVKAAKADLFIVNGLELEIGYESLILEGSRNPDIQKGRLGYLDASDGITPLEVPQVVDRSMGDIHAGGNPHYWIDPLNVQIAAFHIAARLSQLSPEDSSYFEGNLTAFRRKIDEKMKQWSAQLAPYQGAKLVSYHQSWTYLAGRFGLKIVGQLEPKPGIPPSPAHLKDIIDLVQRENIKVILNENIYKTDAARYVAQRTRAKVVVAPISVGGVKEAVDYFALMDMIVARLAEGFRE